ncbi:hypothetical protein ACJJTC_018735, partial [Scirpophaga incertulas]
DSGYALRPNPILHGTEGTPEFRYSETLKKARATIERCNGVLKGRFRCLLKDRGLHYQPIGSHYPALPYNDSIHVTNASELNKLNCDKDIEDISDVSLRDISPIPMVPLSESLFRDCVLEAVGEQKRIHRVATLYLTLSRKSTAQQHQPKVKSQVQMLKLPILMLQRWLSFIHQNQVQVTRICPSI